MRDIYIEVDGKIYKSERGKGGCYHCPLGRGVDECIAMMVDVCEAIYQKTSGGHIRFVEVKL